MTRPLDSIILNLSVGQVEQAQKAFSSVKDKLPKGLTEAITTIFNSKTETTQKALKPQVMARQIRGISGKPARALETPDSIIHILSYLEPYEFSEWGRINRLWNSLIKQALVYQLNDPLRVGFIGDGKEYKNTLNCYYIGEYRKAGLTSKTIFETLGCRLRKLCLSTSPLWYENIHAYANRYNYLAEINQECPNIEFLRIQDYTAEEFQHDQFIALARCQKRLSTLELNQIAMTQTVFATLRNFASLTNLSLMQSRLGEKVRFDITLADCAIFKEIPRLQSLSLTKFEFNDDLMTHIIACPNLNTLSLNYMSHLTDRSLSLLSQAEFLNSLELVDCDRILGTDLTVGLLKLKKLKLRCMEQFSRAGLTSLVQMSPSLIELHFNQSSNEPSSGQQEAQEMIRLRREALNKSH